jgi:hypothetical protein
VKYASKERSREGSHKSLQQGYDQASEGWKGGVRWAANQLQTDEQGDSQTGDYLACDER